MATTDDLLAIANADSAARSRPQARWADSADAGQDVPPAYHPTHLASTLGSLFTPPAAIVPLLDALQKVADHDERVTPVPRPSLHFTFLALTPHAWESVADMPDAGFLLNAVERSRAA